MLTIEDCIELSGLTEEEVDALAEHEHLPEIVAAQLGNYLVQSPEGEQRITAMILDDLQAAQERADFQQVLKLKLCLKHFLAHHARPSNN